MGTFNDCKCFLCERGLRPVAQRGYSAESLHWIMSGKPLPPMQIQPVLNRLFGVGINEEGDAI